MGAQLPRQVCEIDGVLKAFLVAIVLAVALGAGCRPAETRADATQGVSPTLKVGAAVAAATAQGTGAGGSPFGEKGSLNAGAGDKSSAPTDHPDPTATPLPPPTEGPALAEREDALLRSVRYRAANGPVVFAYPIPDALTIDGFLDEWGGHVYDVTHVSYNPDAQAVGADDLSGRFYCAWDTGNLYLAVDVSDDVHDQSQTGKLMYKGDDIELQIDADLEGDFSDGQLGDDDAQLGLSAGDFGAKGPEAYIWRPPSREQVGTMIGLAAQGRVGGYTLEAAIPWWVLGGRPALETPLGFCLSLSDSDTPGAARQDLMVSSCPDREWGDPTTWGTLIVVDWE